MMSLSKARVWMWNGVSLFLFADILIRMSNGQHDGLFLQLIFAFLVLDYSIGLGTK